MAKLSGTFSAVLLSMHFQGLYGGRIMVKTTQANILWILSCSWSTALTRTANSMQRKCWADPRRRLFWGPDTRTDLGWETQQPCRQKLFCVSSPKQHISAILHQQRAQMLQVPTAPTQRQRHSRQRLGSHKATHAVLFLYTWLTM